MEQYSRRFIEELAKHINPTILEFFNKKKKLMNFPTDKAGIRHTTMTLII